jgi:hypothetical protein
MTQQSFQVGNKPRVVVTHLRGNLTVHPWRERQISIAGEGPIADLHQEGDSVIIDGCESDLELWVPNMKPIPGGITTQVSVKDVQGRAFIEEAGSVELEQISGGAELVLVWGSLRAVDMPSLHERKGIGGSATIEKVSRVEIGAVGGNLALQQVEFVVTGAVGGSLDADGIGAKLQCGAVGGSCHIVHSSNADVAVSNVGGSLQMTGVARMHSCNVGGSLQLEADFPVGSSAHLLVGGSATVTLPENANLHIQVMAGGPISGETLPGKPGNFLNVVYGDGAAHLSLTAGGSVHLLSKTAPSSARANFQFDDFGRSMAGFGQSMAEFGREMGKVGREFFTSVVETMSGEPVKTAQESKKAQQREAILRMVAQGRITPEEGNMLLEALEG